MKVVSPESAQIAAAALMEVVKRMRARGRDDLANGMEQVAQGLAAGGVIVAGGSA